MILVRALVGVGLAALAATAAHGRDPDGRYASADPAVRQWYQTRTLTPEAEKRFGYKSCCDAGDVVKTRFRGEGNAWFWLSGERWEQVPPDIIHWGMVTPTNEPVLFAVGGKPVCFFPGAGGI